MLISITAVKYASALERLKSAPKAEVKSLTINPDGVSGQLDTDLVDLNFRYNGSDTMDVQVSARHGMAKFASDKTIQSHVQDLLDTE